MSLAAFWRRPILLWLLVGVVAAIPRLQAIETMPAFGDEVYWLLDGHEAFQRWQMRDGPNPWGERVLRHPGTPTALAGGLAERTRNPQLDRVSENERILHSARFLIVWFGVVGCVVLAALGARLYGAQVGVLAGIALALSPQHVANSAWLQCDTTLATFSTGAVLSLALHLREGGWRWLLGSAVMAGLAISSKWPALVLLPFALASIWVARFSGGAWRLQLRNAANESLLWLCVAMLVLFITWPRMWFDPFEFVKTILWARQVAAEHLTYFQGAITYSPAWYYYFVAVPLSLSELETVLLGTGLLATLTAALRGDLRVRRETWLLLAWLSLFLLAMTLSSKKLGARYVLPIWPILALLGAITMASGLAWLRDRAGPLAAGVSGLALLLAASTSLFATGGNPMAHANRLLGGLPAMDRAILIVGVADHEIAGFLDTLPAPATIQVAGNLLSTQWHSRRHLLPATCDLLQGHPLPRSVAPIAADYVGVFSHFSKRCTEWNDDAMKSAGAVEVHRMERDGVVLARVYQRPGNVIGYTGSEASAAPR